MRRSILILLLFLFPTQPRTAFLDIAHQSFRVDDLGRMQVLYNGSLDLYNAKAQLIGHHSESLLGRISSMDRISALKLLVFYADIPAFQILDNALSPHSEVYDLNAEDMGNITAVCMSANNTFWGYDGVSFELIRFDDNYRILSSSGNTVLTAGHVLDPVRMTEYSGRLFVADAEEGVFVFDQFGSYERTIPYKGIIDMDIEKAIIYLSDGQSFDRVPANGSMLIPAIEELEGLVSFDVVAGNVYFGDGKKIRKRTLDSLFD